MKVFRLFLPLALLLASQIPLSAESSILWQAGSSLVPYPQEVVPAGEPFLLRSPLAIVLDEGADEQDRFSAKLLAEELSGQWEVEAEVDAASPGSRIVLTREGAPRRVGEQGYTLETSGTVLTIRANTGHGIFHGVQTLLQLVVPGNPAPRIEGVRITDWPDMDKRAVHYDTKHFQEREEYVRGFIRELARYKVNMLIWEWEDKFDYRRHPQVGAPGAFTMRQMKDFTEYARRYHIEIVPLVQGLGHVSFILKHPEFRHLREVPSSNWQNSAVNEGTYELMFDLWDEAIEATPGSGYFHIGTDETWELGAGATKELAGEIGTYGVMMRFIERAHKFLTSKGRRVMSWGGGWRPGEEIEPPEDLITFGWYGYDRDKAVVEAGWPLFFYDPNPGIEHMFLPYFHRERRGRQVPGCLEVSVREMSQAALSGLYEGMVATSWNCSGVHNQLWMLRYITAAEYAWSGRGPTREEFTEKFFKSFYGRNALDMPELFRLLNEGSYFYSDCFERRVWHWGEVGKTHLPDLPRDDVEYDPYWNTEYAEMVSRSREILPLMDRVKDICRVNLSLGVRNGYDFELFESLAELFSESARTYLDLSALEKAIGEAHEEHFKSHRSAYRALERAARIVEDNIAERESMYARFKATWEKSQLPKGMSTAEEHYVHGRDRQRNFANRTPDLSFVIHDERLLGLDDYLARLREYMDFYRAEYLDR